MGDDSSATAYAGNPALCAHDGERTAIEAGGFSITECASCGVVLSTIAVFKHVPAFVEIGRGLVIGEAPKRDPEAEAADEKEAARLYRDGSAASAGVKALTDAFVETVDMDSVRPDAVGPVSGNPPGYVTFDEITPVTPEFFDKIINHPLLRDTELVHGFRRPKQAKKP